MLVMVAVCARSTLPGQGGGGMVATVAYKYKYVPRPLVFVCLKMVIS